MSRAYHVMVVGIDSVGFVIFGRHGLHIRAVAPAFPFRARVGAREESGVAAGATSATAAGVIGR